MSNSPETNNKSLQNFLEEIAEQQDPITIEDIQKLIQSFGAEDVLSANSLPYKFTLMTFCCAADIMTVPMMQLFIDEAKKIGVNSHEFLKQQFEYKLGENSDARFDGATFICMACAGTSSLPVIQLLFSTCIDEFSKEWLLKQLQAGFGNSLYLRDSKALGYICKYGRSVEVLRFVFNTFLEIGGKEALLKELSQNQNDLKHTLLVVMSIQKSSSVEKIQVVLDQYANVDSSLELLKKQFKETLTQHALRGWRSVLSIVAMSDCSHAVFSFFAQSVRKICGSWLVEEQFSKAIFNEFQENTDRVKQIIARIIQYGGCDLLQRLFENSNDGLIKNILEVNDSIEILQFLVTNHIKDKLGPESVKKLMFSTTLPSDSPVNLLHLVSQDLKSSARLDLVIRTILQVGGKNLLRQMLEAENKDGKTCLHIACTQHKSTQAVHGNVKKLITAILFAGGNESLLTIFNKNSGMYDKIDLVTAMFATNAKDQTFDRSIEIILSKIIEVGGKGLLRRYLRHLDSRRSPPLCTVSKNSCDYEARVKLFVALLVEFDIFREQYAALDKTGKAKLKENANIENDEWLPSETEKRAVDKILQQGELDPDESERQKQFEEEASTALKQFEESCTVKNAPSSKEEQGDTPPKITPLIKRRSIERSLEDVAEQQGAITIDDFEQLLLFFGPKEALEASTLSKEQSLMMYCSERDQMTVPIMQLFIDKARKIGGNNEFLKKQLERARREDQVTFICVACAGSSSSLPVVQLLFATGIEEFGKEWLLKQFQLSFGSINKTRVLWWICTNARSIDIVRFVFNTFLEIGGKAALLKELAEVNPDGLTALTSICSQQTCSVEIAQLIMDQYSEAGDVDQCLLKKHLTLETKHQYTEKNALTRVGMSSCPDRVFEFFIASIGKICGENTLKQQLTSGKNTTPLLHICAESSAESVGHAKLIIFKILELSDSNTLKKEFECRSRGSGFLYSILECSVPVEMLQLLIDTAKDNFEPDFLVKVFLAGNLQFDKNWLHMSARNTTSAANLDLAIRTTLELGGVMILKTMLTNPKNKTPLHALCDFPHHDKEPHQKLKLLINHILSVGGKKLLQQVLAAQDKDGNTVLRLAYEQSRYPDQGADDTINMLIDAILFAGGNDFLVESFFEKEVVGSKTQSTINFVIHLFCCYSPRLEAIEPILARVVDVGGIALLKKYLSQHHPEKDGKSPLSFVSKQRSHEDGVRVFAALLVKLDIFSEQYESLDDGAKEDLKNNAKIHSSHWRPTEDERLSLPSGNPKERVIMMKLVENILRGGACQQESERRHKFEEEVTLALKQFEELNAAKIAEEEAAAKKKAEEEAAAKKKAEEEAAAVKKKAKEEAAAAKKKEKEEAAAKKKAEEEAAAAKKKAEEEAAAKEKAEEEATAAKKKAEEEAALAKQQAEEPKPASGSNKGLHPTSTHSSNEPANTSCSSSTVPYEKMQEDPEEEKEKPVRQGCPCAIQ